jgi:hypothetical protein
MPETVQGGQGAVVPPGCNTPIHRMVLPPWSPTQPSAHRASWSGVTSPAVYEVAGHFWPERQGTALERMQDIGIHIDRDVIAYLQDAETPAPQQRQSRVIPANRRSIASLGVKFLTPNWVRDYRSLPRGSGLRKIRDGPDYGP